VKPSKTPGSTLRRKPQTPSFSLSQSQFSQPPTCGSGTGSGTGSDNDEIGFGEFLKLKNTNHNNHNNSKVPQNQLNMVVESEEDPFGGINIDFDDCDKLASVVTNHNHQSIQCTRYKTLSVTDVVETPGSSAPDDCEKVVVAVIDNLIHSHSHSHSQHHTIKLKGEWYYTKLLAGDIFNIVSVSGSHLTHPTHHNSPLILATHPSSASSQNDLLLILSPDKLISPTHITDSMSCQRKTVLKSKIAGNMFTNRSAVLGTLRHDLFEKALVAKDFSGGGLGGMAREVSEKNNLELLAGGISNVSKTEQTEQPNQFS